MSLSILFPFGNQNTDSQTYTPREKIGGYVSVETEHTDTDTGIPKKKKKNAVFSLYIESHESMNTDPCHIHT